MVVGRLPQNRGMSFARSVLGCLALALAFALAGCDEDKTPEPVSPAATPTVAAGDSGCALQAALEQGSRLGGELRGDVTGDGSEDVVYLIRHPEGAPGCVDLLFAETENEILGSALTDGRDYALAQPRLNSLAAIDREPGAEIVVDLEQGASTQFVGIFTVRDDELERIRFQGESGQADLFPYGGSVGHIEASDCGETVGTVVVSIAVPKGEMYEVERSVYRFEAVDLVLDRGASERIEVAADEVQDLPEYRSPPFGTCALP